MREISKNLSNDEIILWRLLIEQSRDGIVVLDQNCKVYEANKKFAEMLGYSIEEVYQLYVWDWDNKFTKEEILEMADDIDESGHHFETQHRRKVENYISQHTEAIFSHSLCPECKKKLYPDLFKDKE